VRPSELPFDVDNRHLVLVDDVLHTGRTIRAALNELFDYGRPASVLLAVLVDRGGRELPIEAHAAGSAWNCPPTSDQIQLTGPDHLQLLIQNAPMSAANIQLDRQGRWLHFLTVEGLSRRHLTEILDTAESLRGVAERRVKKAAAAARQNHPQPVFRGQHAHPHHLRTGRQAAVSADVVNLNIATSSTSKGESLLDTLRISKRCTDMFVVRHEQFGAAQFIAEHVKPGVAVLNAGDGRHAHPTQAHAGRLHHPPPQGTRFSPT
jgi:hypothetical protein